MLNNQHIKKVKSLLTVTNVVVGVTTLFLVVLLIVVVVQSVTVSSQNEKIEEMSQSLKIKKEEFNLTKEALNKKETEVRTLNEQREAQHTLQQKIGESLSKQIKGIEKNRFLLEEKVGILGNLYEQFVDISKVFSLLHQQLQKEKTEEAYKKEFEVMRRFEDMKEGLRSALKDYKEQADSYDSKLAELRKNFPQEAGISLLRNESSREAVIKEEVRFVVELEELLKAELLVDRQNLEEYGETRKVLNKLKDELKKEKQHLHSLREQVRNAPTLPPTKSPEVEEQVRKKLDEQRKNEDEVKKKQKMAEKALEDARKAKDQAKREIEEARVQKELAEKKQKAAEAMRKELEEERKRERAERARKDAEVQARRRDKIFGEIKKDAKAMHQILDSKIQLYENSSYSKLLEHFRSNWLRGSNFKANTNLLPLPSFVEFKRDKRLFRFYDLKKGQFMFAVPPLQSQVVKTAIERLQKRLQKFGSVLNKFDNKVLLEQDIFKNWIGEMRFSVSYDKSVEVPALEDNEGYILVSSVEEKKLIIKAKTSTGVIRALSTLSQFVLSCDNRLQVDNDCERYLYLPSVKVEDKPAFPWRGVMIDSARHFQPMHEIYSTIDGMELVKLNVLHWHLSDDQGFRVESKVFPLLQKKSYGKFYTQKDIKKVIQYASDRGIRVIPEFDMPV